MTTVYIALREGQNRLIVDGSLQLFGRLLEAMRAQSPPVTLPEIENQIPGDYHPAEVQHATAAH
jgi:hypothetical protein